MANLKATHNLDLLHQSIMTTEKRLTKVDTGCPTDQQLGQDVFVMDGVALTIGGRSQNDSPVHVQFENG